MYNNEITYHEKWNTPENLAAFKMLKRKYFSKSICGPSCPVAWAPEVLEMMNTLQRKLGFYHNESTIQGYHVQGNPLRWFIINPYKGLIYSFQKNVLSKPTKYNRKNQTSTPKSFSERAIATSTGFFEPIMYGLRALTVQYVNPIRNRIENNKIHLSQLKEKYGYLTCYFDADDKKYKDIISSEISKCAIKLTEKGCYYSIEKTNV